ncbi:hypothetical protein [Methanosarcina horonobensis]|nr:hypothetical protein [Methanosarcina horonobensis]
MKFLARPCDEELLSELLHPYTVPQGKEVIMGYEPGLLDDSFYFSLGE